MEGATKKRSSANQETGDLEDRISDLPDPLICHILAFLKMEDVMKTSLLARRWRSLWTTVPVLDFDNSWTENSSIATLIAHSFIRYEGVKIRKFRAIAKKYVNECEIDSWLHFTTKRGIEELDIMSYYNYMLPRLLDYGSLRVLKLAYCVLDLHATDCFPSLRELHLYRVDFTDINTSGCPLLEELTMEHCTKCRSIFAPNKKLRYLKDETYWCTGLTIYAPHLLSIEFYGFSRQYYNLKNVASVKSVIIGFISVIFYTEPEEVHDTEPKVMLNLIKNLAHAKTLKLSEYSIQMLNRENILNMPYLSASSMRIDISFGDKSGLRMITSLLNRSRRLENLIIRNRSKVSPLNYANDISWKLLALALHLLKLRTVTIHGFLESAWFLSDSSFNVDELMENLEKGEMKLIKLLLKGCTVLDKLVIHSSDMSYRPISLQLDLQKKREEKKGFSELCFALMSKLLLLPRASVNAGVEFSWIM